MAGSSLRPRGTSAAVTERPQVVSGPWAAPSAKPLVPHSLPRSPRRWGDSVRGGGVLLGLAQSAPCPQVPHSGQGPSQHLPAIPPTCPPHPQASETGQERTQERNPRLEAARGPIQPSDPRSREPGCPSGCREYLCAKIPTSTNQRSQASDSERGVDATEPGGSLCPRVGLSTGVAADTFCPVPWGRGLKHLIMYLTSN